jgi:predicted permease
MFSIWFSILNFLVVMIAFPVTMVILGTNNLRVKLMPEKRINFLQALLSCFIILFIGFFISVLYSYIFNHWIDPEYMKYNIEKFTEMMQGYNVPQETIDEQVAKMEENMGISRQIIFSLGITVVLSLILALIVRKKDKETEKMY